MDPRSLEPEDSREPLDPPLSAPGEALSRLFHEARCLSGAERQVFLNSLPSREAHLLPRLQRLLSAHDEVEAGDDPLSGLVRGLEEGRAAALLHDAPFNAPGHGGLDAPSGPALSPGDLVGRYRIIRQLGKGGMGAVHEAHDPLLDRLVALKFLPPDLDEWTRLLDEARAASALDHPCIGTLYEIGQDAEGRSFLAMARYPGGTLRQRLRDGPLPAPEAVRIAIQVAEALDAAHSRGILHRDVKPENLLFDEAARVKLVDFGIARVLGTAAPGMPRAGTLPYMSPEEVEGRPSDGRADLWSLGIVLFEMLTGQTPFRSGDPRAILEALGDDSVAGVVAEYRELDPELRAVIERLLSHDPAARYPSGASVARALERFATSRPDEASDVRPLFGKRLGRRLVVPAAGLILLLVGSGILLSRQSPRLMEARGFAGEAFSPRGEVLVPAFQVPEDLDELALATREALLVDLQQSGFVRVLPRVRVEQTLGLMALPPNTSLEGSLALEVAERAGAGVVLETTLARAGNRTILASRGLDPRSGDELFAVRTSAGDRGLLGAVERLSREIRRRLGEAAESLAESHPLPQVTTPSLEALRLYALAERAMVDDPFEVPRYLEAALAIDPAFAMAHRLAAASGVNRMRFEETTRHLSLAWEHRERLPDRERWLVEAAHASETLHDPLRAEALYERIVLRFPDEFLAWTNLANTRLSWLKDPEGAVGALQASLDLDADRLQALPVAAQTALVLGDLGQADALMARAEGPSFEAVRARWAVTRAFWLDDSSGLREACRSLLDAGFPPMPQADDREVCGSMLLVQGDFELAKASLDPLVEHYTRQESFRNLASVLHALAYIDLAQGDTARARARFDEALDRAPADRFGEPDRFIFRTNLQVPAALMGWPDLVARIGEAYPPFPDSDHLLGRGGEHLVRAALALERGDGLAALEALEASFPPGIMALGWRTFDELLRAMAFELLGDPDMARLHYREAAHRGWAGFAGLTKDRLHLLPAAEGLARLGELP